ncbi:MAG: 3-isopropylmalate dehydratase small subunit [Opitutales bacterium]
MSLEKIENFEAKAVHIVGNDIDTDRIIPARFMVCVTFEGLGKYAFYDERKNEDGSDKDFILNKPEYKDAKIILSGENFGCGSSREHAPQALWHYGIRAIIAESFAEIFFGNSTTLGIPCVCVAKADIAKISEASKSNNVKIDLVAMTVSSGDVSVECTMPENARSALISGTWDPIAELLESDTDATYSSLIYTK